MLRIIYNTVICLLLILSGCSDATADDFVQVTLIKDDRISESSGLAASYANPNSLWIHNDSGDKPRLYLVGLDGNTKAEVDIDDVNAYDWEDMCSFQLDGASRLMVGDIGDNDKQRGGKQPDCRLYLLNEPRILEGQRQKKVDARVSATIRFVYEDGPQDCEGVAVDVERREILLMTKSAPQKCGLYVMPLNLANSKQKYVAKRIASPFIPFATALDISPSGRTMVVGSMFNGIIVIRKAEQSWSEAFVDGVKPLTLPQRRQGETICFDRTGQSIFLNSEHKDQPLWRVTLP